MPCLFPLPPRQDSSCCQPACRCADDSTDWQKALTGSAAQMRKAEAHLAAGDEDAFVESMAHLLESQRQLETTTKQTVVRFC